MYIYIYIYVCVYLHLYIYIYIYIIYPSQFFDLREIDNTLIFQHFHFKVLNNFANKVKHCRKTLHNSSAEVRNRRWSWYFIERYLKLIS